MSGSLILISSDKIKDDNISMSLRTNSVVFYVGDSMCVSIDSRDTESNWYMAKHVDFCDIIKGELMNLALWWSSSDGGNASIYTLFQQEIV